MQKKGKTSKHAKKRIKQRHNNIDKFELAIKEGIYPKDAKGGLKRYLDRLTIKHKSKIVIYKNFIYIFSKSNVMITTFGLPAMFHKYTKKIEQQKEKENE